MRTSVADDAGGYFVVTTESGTRYWLDLSRRQIRRTIDPARQPVLRLRRDSEIVDLIEIVRCQVGEPLIVLIDLNLPGVWLTTRESSTVVRIDQVPAGLVTGR